MSYKIWLDKHSHKTVTIILSNVHVMIAANKNDIMSHYM